MPDLFQEQDDVDRLGDDQPRYSGTCSQRLMKMMTGSGRIGRR